MQSMRYLYKRNCGIKIYDRELQNSRGGYKFLNGGRFKIICKIYVKIVEIRGALYLAE